MLPNFLGIGAARAGSTWIARNLMVHPDIFLPGKKELHFFDRHYSQDLSLYEQEFSAWSGECQVGEITPQYFHNEAVAPLIAQHFPEIRLFVCLRNPVERAYSHYWRLVAVSGDDRQPSFEELLDAPNDILQVGCYADHLTRYFNHFSRDQILILLFDDIRDQPQVFLSEIYEFLGVEDKSSAVLARQRINAAASLQDLGRSKALWYAYRAIRRFGFHSLAERLEQINSSDLPPMKPDTRIYLTSYYRDQIDQLQDLTHRNLGNWLEPNM